MIDGSWSWSWGVILANRIHKLHHTNRVEAIILTDFYVVMLYTHLAKSPTALLLTILFQPTPIIAEIVFFPHRIGIFSSSGLNPWSALEQMAP